MVDRLVTDYGPAAGPITRRYRDMGDGTFAEIVYAAGLTPGGDGAGVDLVAVKDGTDATRTLVVDADGRITAVVANPTANPETGLAKESTLTALLAELGQKLEPGGTVALDAATLAALETISAVVSGTVAVSNLPATQPVSGTVTVANPTPAASPAPVATAAVTATGAAAAAVTLTLPVPGAGLFHHLTSLEVFLYNSAARTGTATPVTVTTTNLPGNPALTFPSAGAIGTVDRYALQLAAPLKATAAATATTVVCPATAGVLWRATATYYTA